MKSFILFLLLTGVASAEVIDLPTTLGSGYLHQYQIGNISLLPPQQPTYPGGVLYIDGEGFVCDGMLAYPEKDLQYVYLCKDSFNGITVSLTLTETWTRKQINNGRAHYWVTKWTLVSGTIVR